MNLNTTRAGRQAAIPQKLEGTGYTGHDNKQAGIQRHSMGEHFARYQIIMAFAPKAKRWIAMRNGEELAQSKDYTLALAMAQLVVIKSIANGVQ